MFSCGCAHIACFIVLRVTMHQNFGYTIPPPSHPLKSGFAFITFDFTMAIHSSHFTATIRRYTDCAAIHGDLSQDRRTQILDGFKDGSIRIMVATDVAARGLDVPELSKSPSPSPSLLRVTCAVRIALKRTVSFLLCVCVCVCKCV